jgi:OOP family OmpA-OmpF porin
MEKNYLKVLFLLVLSILLVSCAPSKPLLSPLMCKPQKLRAAQHQLKKDNFLVILDASYSMVEKYKGHKKFDLAKGVVDRMNQTLPDLKLNGALRTFGHGSCISNEKTVLLYGMTEHTTEGLEKGLEAAVCAGGNSPMEAAIDAAGEDLSSIQGGIALIIVSDGKEMSNAPVEAAENLKQQFGDKLCIYPVLVGDDSAGKTLMEKIAQVSGCGFAVTADSLLCPDDMAAYVAKVFLTAAADSDGDGVDDILDQCPETPPGVKVDKVGCPLDTDGDGIYDYLDKCPDTPKGVKVDSKGCPLDTDGDGVYDYLDKCPGTPAGAKVNEQGCWIPGGVLFDFGKWDIKPHVYPELDAIVKILKKNPDLKLEIQGHTDNIGSAAFNKKLSENRANAVMEYLVKKGIQPERLSAKGYGFSMPVASNDTPEGRAKNRRVQLMPVR